MADNVQQIVNGIGAMAETTGLLRERLIASGFTRAEAIQLCQTYLQTMLTEAKNTSSKG